nr:hypothetical protein [uncultured Flavobacterium sp.]
MKNFIHPQIRILFFCIILFTLTTCENTDDTVPYQSSFSFTYNGKQYNLGEHKIGPYGGVLGPEQEWLVSTDGSSIWINRPDIFGGVIKYKDPNCTFLSPVHDDVANLYECQLTSNGNPIDSIVVYFYKSGNHTFSYENCITKKVIDFYTGGSYNQTNCDIIGTFDLKLVNAENKIISITNGKYKFKVIK